MAGIKHQKQTSKPASRQTKNLPLFFLAHVTRSYALWGDKGCVLCCRRLKNGPSSAQDGYLLIPGTCHYVILDAKGTLQM